mmetsp:Transcript_8048/g.24939  ORF Transcript_8048/g.24939 Transcript_8048/m.24939 type:complete len:1183 (+) Transcript_8048:176-3724(+)|eukprot:CAMPEP_0174243064 /NCGR_PEP_ID=MMETSP0417-20130205/30195_1 /TAXON_ID=242541 /ORGANISM="Mayorella sp, Strain BSH-02190019" /LENGTH=1182 /DNA_ID=CAMNT_0015322519 /DNA_START=150 /DNA_END=3698 /DNA_ORIENTATION=+
MSSTILDRDQAAIKAGFLVKRGQRRHTWKKRWFVLSPDQELNYFAKVNTTESLGCLAIAGSTVSRAPEIKKSPHAFSITTANGRVLFVYAETDTECNEWILTLAQLAGSNSVEQVSRVGQSATAGELLKRKTKPIPAGGHRSSASSSQRHSVPDLDLPTSGTSSDEKDEGSSATFSPSADSLRVDTPRLVDSDPPPPSLPSTSVHLFSKSVDPKASVEHGSRKGSHDTDLQKSFSVSSFLRSKKPVTNPSRVPTQMLDRDICADTSVIDLFHSFMGAWTIDDDMKERKATLVSRRPSASCSDETISIKVEELDRASFDPNLKIPGVQPRSGFLEKKGRSRKNWNKRWFEMKQNGILYYYRFAGTDKPAGCITLDEAQVKRVHHRTREFCFRLERDNRVLFISTSSQEDLEGWLEVICWNIKLLATIRREEEEALLKAAKVASLLGARDDRGSPRSPVSHNRASPLAASRTQSTLDNASSLPESRTGSAGKSTPRKQRTTLQGTIHSFIQDGGSLEQVERYLKSNQFKLTDLSEDGQTPLHAAVQEDRVDLVQFFLEKGADTNVQDVSGWTPCHCVQSSAVLHALVRHEKVNFDIVNNDNATPIFYIVRIKDLSATLFEIVKDQCDLSIRNSHKETLLHAIVVKGNETIMRFALNNSSLSTAVNVCNRRGESPLQYAVRMHRADMAILLLEHGADPHLKSVQGSTAYEEAKLSNQVDLVKVMDQTAKGRLLVAPQPIESLCHLLFSLDDEYLRTFFLMYRNFLEPSELFEWLFHQYKVDVESRQPSFLAATTTPTKCVDEQTNAPARSMTLGSSPSESLQAVVDAEYSGPKDMSVVKVFQRWIGIEVILYRRILPDSLRLKLGKMADREKKISSSSNSSRSSGLSLEWGKLQASLARLERVTVPEAKERLRSLGRGSCSFHGTSGEHSFPKLHKDIWQASCVVDYHLLRAIHPDEFLNQNWTKHKERAPNLMAFIHHFNQFSHWVALTILQPTIVEERVTVIQTWLAVANSSLKHNNFSSLMAIVGALQCTAIHRLNHTWSQTPKADRLAFQFLQSLVSPEGSYKNYRSLLASAKPPCIPYIGMILRDLTYIDDGNRDSTLSSDGQQLIHFSKSRQVYSALSSVFECQQKPYSFDESSTLNDTGMVSTLPVLNIQEEQLRNLPIVTENELYEMSLIREPRIGS